MIPFPCDKEINLSWGGRCELCFLFCVRGEVLCLVIYCTIYMLGLNYESKLNRIVCGLNRYYLAGKVFIFHLERKKVSKRLFD